MDGDDDDSDDVKGTDDDDDDDDADDDDDDDEVGSCSSSQVPTKVFQRATQTPFPPRRHPNAWRSNIKDGIWDSKLG